MTNAQLYNKEGWLNIDTITADRAPIIVLIGGRGIGKTYAILRHIALTDTRFIYMRRQQNQIDLVKLPELNPFAAVNGVDGIDIISGAIGKYVAGFWKCGEDGKPQGEPQGIGVALSSIANVRGIDASAYTTIVYDEFIPEKHERPIRAEGEAFLNALETFGRNRELLGKEPLKVYLLTNTNKLDSPILEALDIIKPLDRMCRRNQNYMQINNGLISVYRYTDSPVSEAKRNTVLYRIGHNEDFARMALENAFDADSYEYVEPQQIAQYTPLVTIGGITVHEHKSIPGVYYVTEGGKAPQQYTDTAGGRASFRRAYFYLYDALLDRRVRYASAPVKVYFERVWRNG